MNNQWIKEITRETGKYVGTNENENHKHTALWDAAQQLQEGRLQWHRPALKRPPTKALAAHLEELQKGQGKPTGRGREEQ